MRLRAGALIALLWCAVIAPACAQQIIVRDVRGDYAAIVASDFEARHCADGADGLAYFAFFDEVYAIPLSQIRYLAPRAVPEATTEADAAAGLQRYPIDATCREAPLEAATLAVAGAGPQRLDIAITSRLRLWNAAETLRGKRASGACSPADGGALVRCSGTMSFGQGQSTRVDFFIASDPRLVQSGDVPVHATCTADGRCDIREEFGRTSYRVRLPRGAPTLAAILDTHAAAQAYMASIRAGTRRRGAN